MKDRPLTCVFSTRIFRNEKCFGKGIAQLLQLVDERKSLRQATLEMNIAYSKAWNVLKTAERELGFKLLNATTGGKHGGGATLTEEARKLLKDYNAFYEEANTAVQAAFEKHFAEYR